MNKNLFRKVLFYISVPKCVACKAKLDVDDDGFIILQDTALLDLEKRKKYKDI